jgi:ectoine hydroxylase-related dioxygenase (phytanoyl-CoA dioxygenase family)
MHDIKLHPMNHGFVWQQAPGTHLRRLTREQYADYNERGYTRVERVFSPAEIEAVTGAIDPIEQRREQYVKEHEGGRLRLSEVDIITFTVHIVRESAVLRAFAAHPAIKDICHDLIGGDVRLYWDQSVYKKTSKPQEFPWHQDNGYTFIDPQQYLTCWMPLVDVDTHNGCPSIAPRLHRIGTLAHWRTPIGLQCFTHPSEVVEVPARAGDLIVFSSLAPHRTGPNLRSGTVRKAYILQYAPDGAVTYRPDGEAVRQDDPNRQYSVLRGGR